MNTPAYEQVVEPTFGGFLWSLVPVIILGILIGQAVSLSRNYNYRRIIADFFARRYDKLESKAARLRKKIGPNRQGKMKKKNATAYNNLCHVLASLALFRGDTDAFLDRISEMEYEDEYALRPFTLALYYLSEGEEDVAREHYYDFNACTQKDESMQLVMDHLFEPEESGVEAEELYESLNQFRNPATVYLLEKVGLLQKSE